MSLLAIVRDQLQHLFFSLGYVENLVVEAKNVAAVEVAQNDWPQWRAA